MVSIIIPVYNGEKTLARCLTSLQSQTISRDKYEIIVVDDGSKDGTRKVAEGFAVTVISQKNQGPAAARNLGVKMSKGDIVLFIDADCAAAPNWIEEMTKPFSNPDIVGVKGTYKTTQQDLLARFVQLEYEEKYERMKRFPYIDFIDTYSAGFRKDIFQKYGGFNTSFPTATVEDQEFSFRLAKDGHKMVFQPDAFVYHTHQSTLKGYMRRKFWIAYWKVLVLKHHPEKFTNDSHTPQALKFQILLTYAFLLSMPIPYWLLPIPYWLLPVSILGTFFLTTLPFIYFGFNRNRSISLISPVLFFLRSLSFCAGLTIGAIKTFLSNSFQHWEKWRHP
ncbi:MAG TPA: glycosyltransferase [Candidatus Brocadiales bacterium]|nr:glycosyltransferase [Candidatus Brocadiales bacterium]